MKARPVWAFSAYAFEIARRDHVPCLRRAVFLRLGVAAFWAALAVEGRAGEVWHDLRATRPTAEGRRGPRAAARMIDGLKAMLARPDAAAAVAIAAWSLPDSHRARSLGLGWMWAVLCPYCDAFHLHSPGEGRRTPHCCSDRERGQYVLEHAGTLPLEHRARFYRSSMAGLPRLLHHWPERGARREDVSDLLAA